MYLSLEYADPCIWFFQIVKLVMEGSLEGADLWISSSDSDSDSEEGSPSRLWAYSLCTETL